MDSPYQKLDEYFYGSATLGERGQVVIPAEARKECDIHPGDKLLVFRHPVHSNMLILARISDMQQFLQQTSRALEQAGERLEKITAEQE